MQEEARQLLHQSLRRYVRRGAWKHLDRLLERTRDEDLATVMAQLDESIQDTIFHRLGGRERQARLIASMDPPFAQRVLSPVPAGEAAAILGEMGQDDVADILGDLDDSHARDILAVLEEREEVEDLMRYREDTAGGIMVPEYVAVRDEDNADEALATLRESGDIEMVYYVYVVNDHGHLVGVLSLRKLVAAPGETRIREVMDTDVVRVTPDTDQEEVARLVARYGFLALPVVDDSNKLLGLVTVDDVIGVLREEATEDILKMAGAGEELAEDAGVRRNVRIRFPWLLASCVGGLLGAAVMSTFDGTLERHAYLAFYLPLILGMSGNVGTQAATVTVRALALGRVGEVGNRWPVIRRETMVGVMMGLSYGVLVGVVAGLLGGSPQYGTSIGLAFVCGMTLAASVGSSIPLVMNRLSIDPAVATGPFVTTSVDILGIVSYLGIATLLLRFFGLN